MCLKGPWGRVKLVQLLPGHNPRIDLPPREKGPLMQVGGLQGHPAGQEGDATALAVAEIPMKNAGKANLPIWNLIAGVATAAQWTPPALAADPPGVSE